MTSIAALSMAALAHVQAVGFDSVGAAAARLYNFGRLPLATWRRLGVDTSRLRGDLAELGGPAWLLVATGPPHGPWLSWRPRLGPAEPAATVEGGWKLYVSPQPHQMLEAVRATLASGADLPVAGAKCGGDAQGVLRPDKIVVHLATRAATDELAARLLRTLDGCPAHGVPFTAELGADGLLSWGRDPPLRSDTASVAPSWRSWVTWQLAEALAVPAADPCAAALRRIAAAGVDPRTWAPADDVFARSIAA